MKIGILGAGNVGGALGRGWAKAGHQVMFSSRTPDSDKMQSLLAQAGNKAQAGTIAETLAFGDVIVIAIPWGGALESVLADISDWSGKIVMDTTNRFESSASAGKEIAEKTGVPTVKAFNTIGFNHMEKPIYQDTSMFVAGDEHAKVTIQPLVADLGFVMIDAGGVDNMPLLESLAQLWVYLAYNVYGRDIAIQLLQK